MHERFKLELLDVQFQTSLSNAELFSYSALLWDPDFEKGFILIFYDHGSCFSAVHKYKFKQKLNKLFQINSSKQVWKCYLRSIISPPIIIPTGVALYIVGKPD